MSLKNKIIVTAAVTGAHPKKVNNPNIPMTPEEIAADVYDCWKAGAAIAHIHMRDENEVGTMDKELFRETAEILRQGYPDCDIIVNMTTSGEAGASDERRMAHVAMVMSGYHQIRFTQRMAEGRIDHRISSSFADREHRMVHHHYHIAILRFFLQFAEPCQGACEINQPIQRIRVNNDEPQMRQVHEITGSRHGFRSVSRVGERLAPERRERLV